MRKGESMYCLRWSLLEEERALPGWWFFLGEVIAELVGWSFLGSGIAFYPSQLSKAQILSSPVFFFFCSLQVLFRSKDTASTSTSTATNNTHTQIHTYTHTHTRTHAHTNHGVPHRWVGPIFLGLGEACRGMMLQRLIYITFCYLVACNLNADYSDTALYYSRSRLGYLGGRLGHFGPQEEGYRPSGRQLPPAGRRSGPSGQLRE